MPFARPFAGPLMRPNHDADKTRDQLLEELRALRGRLARFEQEEHQRARAEEAARAAEAELQSVLESATDCLWSAESPEPGRWLCRYLSPVIARITGRPEKPFRDDPLAWLQIVHPADLPAMLAGLGRLEAGAESVDIEHRIVRPDGSLRWVRAQARATRLPGRLRLDGSFSDVTERTHLEEQLRQSQKMEAVGQLAGGIAHDFNNLLTIILGYCEVLNGEPPPAVARVAAAEIRRSAERAAALTRQLLAFSRKQIRSPAVLSLNDVVAGLRSLLGRLIGEDVELVQRLDPALGLVRADPSQMEQVVVTLATNARDAMPAGGKLLIATADVVATPNRLPFPGAEPGRYALLSVTDTGCGMDEETRARAFEPFFTTKGVGRGTGLGLATVYGIVKESGGHAEVESAPGKGTTVRVYLPCSGAESPAAAEEAPAEVPARGTETVLLVEDQAEVRALVRETLEELGYSVLEAGDGAAGLAVAAPYPGPIHLLATDVVMPHMGGGELAGRLAALRPGLKVLYLSGYPDDEVVRHGVSRAEAGFLAKPFTPADLARKVREVLDYHEGEP